jgi:hypothetical protein
LWGDGLLAALLLPWMGRSAPQAAAARAWLALGDAARRRELPPPALGVGKTAAALEGDAVLETKHLLSWHEWLGVMADRYVARDPPLAAGAEWVRVQGLLYRLERSLVPPN